MWPVSRPAARAGGRRHTCVHVRDAIHVFIDHRKGQGQMDKREHPATAAKSFAWLPVHMPGVAKLVREKRQLMGDEHVNECFRRGVVAGEPGWFFAREGTLSIGVLAVEREHAYFEGLHITTTQALLVIREPATEGGAKP
jgi:hypothetical protein